MNCLASGPDEAASDVPLAELFLARPSHRVPLSEWSDERSGQGSGARPHSDRFSYLEKRLNHVKPHVAWEWCEASWRD